MEVVTVKFVLIKPVPVLFWAKEQPAKSVAMGAEQAGFPSETPAKAGSPGAMLGHRFFGCTRGKPVFLCATLFRLP